MKSLNKTTMKKSNSQCLLRLLMVLLVLPMAFGNAWGNSYYAKLYASTPNSTSQGKVYVGTSSKPTESARTSENMGSNSSADKTTTLKAWAYTQDDKYAFYKWEFVSSKGNSKTKNTNYTAADIEDKQTDNPIELALNCPSASKNNSDKASLTEIRAIFYRPNGVDISALTFLATSHGQYSAAGTKKDGTTYSFATIRSTQQSVTNVVAGVPIECDATADDGYIFYSYYSLDKYGNKAYIGDLLAPHQILLIEDDVVKVGAEFTDNSYRVGDTFVKTLDDALQAVKQSTIKTIQVVRSHTINAGYYTIPSDVNILIPRDVDQVELDGSNVERVTSGNTPTAGAYKTLTLAKGVSIDCFGTIEVGCVQEASGQGKPGVGRPGGRTYGQLVMNAGSTITLNSGAKLNAWGFITGEGTIDVRRDAVVREMFQMADWKGGTASSGMVNNNNKVFPITQYYIQNIEVPTTYHPGARLIGASSVLVQGSTMRVNDIGIIGIEGRDNAMFLLADTADSEDTWVRKSYDVSRDFQVYEVNNSASLGSLIFSVYVTMDSRNYVLPITHNMKIHLLSGDLLVSQSTELLPGAEIEVNKKATVTIAENQTLYLYDSLQWASSYVYSSQFASRVAYRPGGQPNIRTCTADGLGDAKLNIHGTFDVKGALYTTIDGARIFSNNEDAGTIRFSKAAPTENVALNQFNGLNSSGSATYTSQTAIPAVLRNGDPAHPDSTAGTPAGKSYCYMNDMWAMLTVDPDSSCFVYDQYGVYYAKPGEYVAINVTKDPTTKIISGNDDHTYSDADGAGRLFILMDGCQWWEVENVDNLYHCIHPLNDTYYYWDEDFNRWEEKRYFIMWKDWDGTYLKDANEEPILYKLTYGTMPKFLGTNPTRESDIDYIYDFEGWTPEFTPVKGDQTYTAKYKKTQVKYEIVFKYQEGIKQGSIISRQFLARDENPEVPTLYPIEGYESYEWSPAIAAVTGDQVYEAKWLVKRPKEFEITFVDYDGVTVLQKRTVGADFMPEPPANPSGKPATSEYTYVFDHWSPALSKATEAKTYTAVYREVDRTYDVKFYDEDGETQIGSTQSLPLGATPVPPTCTKSNTAQYTYALEWIDKSTMGGDETDWVKSVHTVTGPASYVAHFVPTLNKYTVTLKSNPAGACTFTGAGVYDYDDDATDGNKITITVTPNDDYINPEWSDGAALGELVDGKYTRVLETLTGNLELAINFTYDDPSAITTIWKSEDGETTLKTVGQKSGTATTYTGATPTKHATAQYTYKFDGWTTEANGGGTYYKNGLTPKATANATYYAHFSKTVRKYTVTLVSSPAGAGTLTGAGTYDYNAATNAITVEASYNNANYTFDGWYNGETRVSTSTSYSTSITTDLTLTAKFTAPTYTIRWKSEDGSSDIETDVEQLYGVRTVFNGVRPTKATDATFEYEFDGWTTEANGGGAFYSNGNTPSVTGNMSYYVHFRAQAQDIEIGDGQTETLSTPTTRNELVLTSNGWDDSGQLIGSDNLFLMGDAHFDFTTPTMSHKWNAVGMPWPVNAETGISVNGRTLVLGKDFDVIYYNGAVRAESGAVSEAWVHISKQADKTLYPGKLYMIGVMFDAPEIRFTKKAGTDMLTTTTSVDAYSSTRSEGDANWNGIANPALFHAYVNAGPNDMKAQYYLSDEDTYNWFTLSARKLVVGEAVFVQAPAEKSIVVNTGSYNGAPRRLETQDGNPCFEVSITADGASSYSDHIELQINEDKEDDKYIIGQDLLKFGISNKVAQMWVNRYDAKLCVNTIISDQEIAEYPLGIFAPQAGDYTVACERSFHTNGYVLYLTYDGKAIANLSESTCTINLQECTTERYGLRLSARGPESTQGFDEILVDGLGATAKKVIRDNKVYIIRGERVYNVDGQLVQ